MDTPHLDAALRSTVRHVCGSGQMEDLTVRRIRGMVEGRERLGEGWFKLDEKVNRMDDFGDDDEGAEKDGERWKERSKRIIETEVDACLAARDHDDDDASTRPASSSVKSTPVKVEKKEKKKKKEKEGGMEDKALPADEMTKGRKRKSGEEVKTKTKAKKRRKKDKIDDDDDDDEEEEGEENGVEHVAFGREQEDEKEEEGRASLTSSVKQRPAVSTLSPPLDDSEEETYQHAFTATKDRGTEDSGSEMSVLIDEPPKKRGRPKAKDAKSSKQESKKKKPAANAKQRTTSTTAHEPPDPDQEEIKRLQGWLVKCGIRKMWWKELQPYETSKPKIRHLKEMLAEAGMNGRYSLDKANQIREERELKADLEAVTAGAKIWGTGDEENGGGAEGRPKRQVAKGLQDLNFLNDDDGEETD